MNDEPYNVAKLFMKCKEALDDDVIITLSMKMATPDFNTASEHLDIKEIVMTLSSNGGCDDDDVGFVPDSELVNGLEEDDEEGEKEGC